MIRAGLMTGQADQSFSAHLFLGKMSLIALIIAYTAHYFGHIPPCHLCVYQRYLYQGIMGLSVMYWLKPVWGKQILWGQVALLSVGCVISVFHSGLEQQMVW